MMTELRKDRGWRQKKELEVEKQQQQEEEEKKEG